MGHEDPKIEYGGAETHDEEEAMARANETIGGVLSQVWQHVREDLAPQDFEKFHGKVHMAFRPASDTTRVWVDAVDHNPEGRNEDTHLRSFRVRLVPPEATPKWEWIVNESVRGSGVAYAPASLEHDSRQPNAREVQDPTIVEIQRAAAVIEECWRLFTSGDKDAVYCWGDKAA
jgi:hypothetical protein